MKAQYKYNIGDLIGSLKILKQTRLKNGENTRKGYEYKCSICGNTSAISEGNLNIGNGCSVCSGNKVLKGYNDLWTTHPNIAEMLKFPEIGYEISYGSRIKQIFICKNCGFEKSISPNTLNNSGIACPKCSDGVSYPNKFIFNMLEQLNINFDIEKLFNWSDKKRYDFHISKFNCIVEAHGSQHYKKAFEKLISSKKIRTFKQEQENDKLKEKLALNNEIHHYIIIDCRKSELEFIKNNILNSKLAEIFDLSNVDWVECHKYACCSLLKSVCDLGNIMNNDIIEISKKVKLCYNTVRKYLRQGSELGWCSYNVNEIKEKTRFKKGDHCKKIICLNTKEIFISMNKAMELTGISDESISSCCRGKTISGGKHPQTGEKLKWMYYDKYIERNLNEAI